jgi:hypothetical protein
MGARAGKNTPFWAVKRPSRPYKSATQNIFTVGAKDAEHTEAVARLDSHQRPRVPRRGRVGRLRLRWGRRHNSCVVGLRERQRLRRVRLRGGLGRRGRPLADRRQLRQPRVKEPLQKVAAMTVRSRCASLRNSNDSQ